MSATSGSVAEEMPADAAVVDSGERDEQVALPWQLVDEPATAAAAGSMMTSGDLSSSLYREGGDGGPSDLQQLFAYLSGSGREEALAWLEAFVSEVQAAVKRLQNDNALLEEALDRERRENQRRLRELEEEAQAYVDAAEPDIRRELSRRYELERQHFESELAALRGEADERRRQSDDDARIVAASGETPSAASVVLSVPTSVGAPSAASAAAACSILVRALPAPQPASEDLRRLWCSGSGGACDSAACTAAVVAFGDAVRRMEEQNLALRAELARAQADAAAAAAAASVERGRRAAAASRPVAASRRGVATDRDGSRANEEFVSQNASLLQEIQQLRDANVALKDANDSLEAEVEDLRKGHRRRIIPPPEAVTSDPVLPRDLDRALMLPLSEELSLAGINYSLPVCDPIPEEYNDDSGTFVCDRESAVDGKPAAASAAARRDGFQWWQETTQYRGGSGNAGGGGCGTIPSAPVQRHLSNRSSQESCDSGVLDGSSGPSAPLGGVSSNSSSVPCPWDAGYGADVTDSGKIYRVILAGDAGVGKTSFIIRLCSGRFAPSTSSTLGVDFQSKAVVMDSKTYTLQLWDTAGQERFRSITRSYFRRADGVLLLYDCTFERSFLSIRKWIDDIEENANRRPPMLICANKTDLSDACTSKGVKVVTREEGQKLAKEYGVLFMESSAKDGRNVTDAILTLTRLIRDLDEAGRGATPLGHQFYKSPHQRGSINLPKKCCS